MKKTLKKVDLSEEKIENEVSWALKDGQTFVSRGNIIPCDICEPAYVPYWEEKNGEKVYGIDEYETISICGWGDIWYCRIRDKNNTQSGPIVPNVDVFFTKKDAERKITALKKTEDNKKLSKWKRKDITKIGK